MMCGECDTVKMSLKKIDIKDDEKYPSIIMNIREENIGISL